MEYRWYGDQINRDVQRAGIQGIKKAGVLLAGYIRSHKLTGQVLHIQSENLRKSIGSKANGGIFDTIRRGNEAIVRVGTKVYYGILHEFGYARGGRVRSFMRTGLHDFEPRIEGIIAEEIRKVL